jgi:cyclopropane fatty-acyl-phospholipid synthase-like methyltransferase
MADEPELSAENTRSSIYSDGEYEQKNPSWHAEDSPWKAEHILRALAFLPQPPRALCEVGCGAGEILRQLGTALDSEAVDLVGYDISPQAIALAQARAGRRLRFVLGDPNTDALHFDVLLAIDVIEHVEDYFSFLRSIRNKADQFIFHIPIEINCESMLRNSVMATRRLYGHLHQFTRDTACATLEECGYTVVHEFYTPGYECMPDNFHTQVTKRVRRSIFAMLPNLSHKLISGCSLMVIARA